MCDLEEKGKWFSLWRKYDILEEKKELQYQPWTSSVIGTWYSGIAASAQFDLETLGRSLKNKLLNFQPLKIPKLFTQLHLIP